MQSLFDPQDQQSAVTFDMDISWQAPDDCNAMSYQTEIVAPIQDDTGFFRGSRPLIPTISEAHATPHYGQQGSPALDPESSRAAPRILNLHPLFWGDITMRCLDPGEPDFEMLQYEGELAYHQFAQTFPDPQDHSAIYSALKTQLTPTFIHFKDGQGKAGFWLLDSTKSIPPALMAHAMHYYEKRWELRGIIIGEDAAAGSLIVSGCLKKQELRMLRKNEFPPTLAAVGTESFSFWMTSPRMHNGTPKRNKGRRSPLSGGGVLEMRVHEPLVEEEASKAQNASVGMVQEMDISTGAEPSEEENTQNHDVQMIDPRLLGL